MAKVTPKEWNKMLMDEGVYRKSVIALRIYYAFDRQPMADLLMSDGVIETIEWTNVKQRKQFAERINGYTLVYDERPKLPWEEAFKYATGR